MFRMIGLGDNIGSGFPAILKAWGDEKWRQPDLYDDQELHQVNLKIMDGIPYAGRMYGFFA